MPASVLTTSMQTTYCPEAPQYDWLPQTGGGVHTAPAVTHSFVSGQQTMPAAHLLPLAAQLTVGMATVRQCLASGQQYEVDGHSDRVSRE